MTWSKQRKLASLLALIFAISNVQSASLIQKRSVGQSPAATALETCLNDSPCGWEVYHPTTRHHAYYVTSSCVCPAGEKCVMASDDLAMAAYVYTCRVLPPRKTKSRNRIGVSGRSGSAGASTPAAL